MLLEQGELITNAALLRVQAELEPEVAAEMGIPIRSVLKCRSEFGVCRLVLRDVPGHGEAV